MVAHAIQHLPLLQTTDPVVGRTLEQWPTLAMALEAHSPFPAGELNDVRM
ncbi:hypothetical protein [Nonomuraea typhae]|nr:hypothetical protein [Nonomuraea typhae]